MLALAISGSQLCKQLRDLGVEPVAVVVEQLRMNETIFLHPKGSTSSVMRLGRVLIRECNDIVTQLLRCIELVSKSNTTEREALRSDEAVHLLVGQAVRNCCSVC